MTEIPKPHSATVERIYAQYEEDARIYAQYVTDVGADNDDNDGVAISQAAEECERRLWYGFRCAYPPEIYTGRMLRLLQTSSREKVRMLDDLRAIGCEVGEQERVRGCGGHLRGKLAARVTGVPEAPKKEHVVGCTAHGVKSFKALLKDGVEQAKPAHYAQMQLYMELTGLTRALYMAHGKDTDELYTERLKYDAVYCARIMAKVDRVVNSPRPLTKLHENPGSKMAWGCGYCPAQAICHEGAWPERNCRTCLHSTAVDGGRWRCEWRKQELTRAEQQVGCPALAYIPDLVPLPWEQVDCDAELGTVTYRSPDGAEFIDGAVDV